MGPDLVERARLLLLANPEYLDDAERAARKGNSVIGQVLTMLTGKPRWATEAAVLQAVQQINAERAQQAQKAPDPPEG
jgi:hypothetical protein